MGCREVRGGEEWCGPNDISALQQPKECYLGSCGPIIHLARDRATEVDQNGRIDPTPLDTVNKEDLDLSIILLEGVIDDISRLSLE